VVVTESAPHQSFGGGGYNRY